MANRMGRRELTVLVGLWISVVWIGSDMYLPAMPTMDETFPVAEALINATLAVYTISNAIGALFGGTLSDRYGRFWPTVIGGVGFFVFNLGCAASPTIEALIAFRILSGLFGGVCTATVMAALKDRLDGPELDKAVTATQSLAIICPILAPFLGSFLLMVASWRAIFILLGVLGVAGTIWYLRVGETLSRDDRDTSSFFGAIGLVFRMCRRADFTLLLIAICLPAFSFGVFMTKCSYIYMDFFGLSNLEYSLFYGIDCVFSIMGPTCFLLLRRFCTNRRVVWICMGALAVSGIILLAFGQLSPFAVAIGCIPFTLAEGIVRPCAYLVLMAAEPKYAGSVSALINFGIMLMTSFGTPVASLPWPNDIVAFGCPILVASIIGLALMAVVMFIMKSHIFDAADAN